MGTAYWKHMKNFLRETMIEAETISVEDLDLAYVTDDPQDAIEHIKNKQPQIVPEKSEFADIY
jgi:predicted Rossmann-fold nucleotide-binding protein